MASIRQILKERFNSAITATFGKDYSHIDPLIQPVNPPHFGDYQANFALSLAKLLNKKPVEIANLVLEKFQYPEICEQAVISGPGFINILLADKFLQDQLQKLIPDQRLGVAKITHADSIVVEYGSPNVAKEMHVGHLRSTIIGDALARIFDFLGYKVIRQNHVGDWGTQFGMLIEFIIENKIDLAKEHDISAAGILYKQAKKRFDDDENFAKKARERVVALQAGDEKTIALWQMLVQESERHFQEVYERLDVLLNNNDIRSESFYNPMLAEIVTELLNKNIATKSEGAVVIFLPGFVDKDKNPVPFIIQKSDGGYLYATTDLAAAKYRIQKLGAKRIIHVVDARQAQHFAMLFATVKLANWANENIRFEHAAFGSVLGKDRKPLKTREGESIKLIDLLNEAERRALAIVSEKTEISSAERAHIAHVVGIGALKYADLSADKIKDYVFDWERMLAFEGNTAPYLQNAYVRIKSIFRKGKINPQDLTQQVILMTQPQERALGLKLLAFADTVELVSEELAPHRLCGYLFDLAAAFHKFYETCPVLSVTEIAQRNSRLLLCELTARTLKLGLSLLGIDVLEQM